MAEQEKDVFDRIPDVSICCFCISVKLGSFLIALFTFVINMNNKIIDAIFESENSEAMCYYPSGTKCTQKVLLRAIMGVDGVWEWTVWFSSLFCMIGFYLNTVKYVTIFLYIIFINAIRELVEKFVIFLVRSIVEDCEMTMEELVFCIPETFFLVLFYIYFIIVVKTYRVEMRPMNSAGS